MDTASVFLSAILTVAPVPYYGSDFAIVQNANACPSGKITCKRWCEKYWRRIQLQCVTSGPNSCIKRFGDVNHCVPDKKPKRKLR